jgi:hypothetical protein
MYGPDCRNWPKPPGRAQFEWNAYLPGVYGDGVNSSNDAAHLADLLRLLNQVDTWSARTSAQARHLETPASSAMGGDDMRLKPYHISHASWASLSHAGDHLLALRALLSIGLVPMFAPYTLIRGALENASMAVWLLAPSRRAERITRRLQVAADDIRNGERARTITGDKGPKTRQQRLAEVEQIAAKWGIDGKAATTRATCSEIIKAVGDPDQVTLLAWNTCSGIAHGDFWATPAAMRMVGLSLAGSPDVGTYQVTANVSLLRYFATFAVEMTNRGWGLYDQRSSSR